MNTHGFRESLYKTGIAAFFSGLVVLVLFYFAIALREDISFSFSGIIHAHQVIPACWIIDLVPVLLAFAAIYIKHIHFRRVSSLENELTQEKEKSEKVRSFIWSLTHDETEARILIDTEHDKLGQALAALHNNLIRNKEEAALRKKEDDQRNWVAEGLARFSEILRENNDNIEELSYQVISKLVKYLDAIQGGFYIINDNNPADMHLQQTACYAYDRKKFAEQRVEWGDGLLGTCILEKQTIYMKNIPEDYVNITSGLGKANPRNLLIVPLLINNEVHGVLEIASFRIFEPYQIGFTEKVAESIASTISSVKINVRTASLLHATQEQAEILASQEEQMRQNMEELQATQEEAARQGEKLASFTNAVNHTLIRAEYDTEGMLIYANTKFLSKLGYGGNAEVEGKHISIFIRQKDRAWFDPIWEGLAKGGRHFEGDMKHVTKDGQDLWTIATYTCMRKDDGSVEKILFLAIDTTDQKKQSLDYEGQIDAMNRSSIKAIFTPSGELIDYNQQFSDALKYPDSEIRDTNLYSYFAPDEHESFAQTWEKVIQGMPFMGVFKMLTKTGDTRWFRGTLTAVHDMYGEISKVIFLCNDITREKIMEIETRKQTEQLKIQEEKLRESGIELQKKLEQARSEMKLQFQEIEKIKIRNELTLEGALDAIVTIDQEGTIEFFNRAAEELWKIDRKDAIGKNIRMLFNAENIKGDEFVSSYVEPGESKIVGVRKEVKITTSQGTDVPVLFLISDAKVGSEHSFTAFIQNIEVELF
jgi:PAS domain S-box-containing protein